MNPTLDNETQEPGSVPEQDGPYTPASLGKAVNFSPDAYADRLMDDLFQEVEQFLNLEPVPSAETDTSSPVRPPVVASSEADAQASLALALPAEVFPSLQLESSAEPVEPLTAVYPAETVGQVVPSPGRSRPTSNTYDRLLLGVGCASVIVSLALWLLYQESHRHPPGIATASPQATVSPAVQENSQFAEYVQKSLQNIDQKAQQNAAIAQLPGANGTNGMPTVTIPKTTVPTAGGPGRSTTGLERVYVPIYQLPPNLYPPGTAVAPLPNFPAKANPNSVGGNRSRPFGTAAITPVPRKLVGVLDKGDRSAALFEVNGVTQRYEIGESISSSGWTLVEVTKDQVIIRRNGEVRSVLIGNGF